MSSAMPVIAGCQTNGLVHLGSQTSKLAAVSEAIEADELHHERVAA